MPSEMQTHPGDMLLLLDQARFFANTSAGKVNLTLDEPEARLADALRYP